MKIRYGHYKRSLPLVVDSDAGFSIVSFVALLPLLVAIIALFAVVLLTFRTDTKARHLCRTELLKSQEIVNARLTSLMNLNPEAEALRSERQSLEQACNMSADPVPCLALSVTITQQSALAVKQKTLIASAVLESRLGPVKAESAVVRSLKGDQAVYEDSDSHLYSKVATHSFHTGSFDVVAAPKDSLTPDYKPSENFAQNQTMRVEWNIALASLLPKWPQSFFSRMKLNLKADCSATIANGGGLWKDKWIPILTNVGKL